MDVACPPMKKNSCWRLWFPEEGYSKNLNLKRSEAKKQISTRFSTNILIESQFKVSKQKSVCFGDSVFTCTVFLHYKRYFCIFDEQLHAHACIALCTY